MIARTSQESANPADSGVEAAVDPWRRHHLHVFIAFGLTWILILGYVLSVGRRFAQLEEEIGRLG